CPYTIYQVYGDERVIERHYDSMQEFMRFRMKNSPDFLGVEIGNGWGDWLSLGEKTPIEYIDTVYFAYSAKLMAEMAAAIGRDDDAKEYNQLFENIRSAFQKKYLTSTGKLSIDNQTTYALALSVGLIPGELIEPAAVRLVELIQENDNRMSTGFLGTRPLLPVLTQTGYNDLACRLLQSRRYPSWGYEIANGATSIWERWNSYTKEDGFASVSMNSFSHYSFGAVCEWMFRWLAGIDCEAPGYKEIVIAPHPPAPGSNPEQEAIHWVKAEYGSIYGLIKSHWKREENRFILEIAIPANTRAKVFLPAASRDSIRINENDLKDAEGIQVLGEESGRFILAVNAGEYRFTSAME
ncbi:MAG: alfa-L-rhamnosidase, partial [Candidatus Omnitrophica bacterium]|nr:alfa-L-rhamnosidase [Candidatus Omnitrophota bacterium]